MARMRTIKPETFTSEMLADLPVAVRWTFVGLWTYVDDEGRGRGDPRLIKAALWPLDDDVTPTDVEGHLAQLEAKGAVCRYESAGKRYLHVVNFSEHQHPNRPAPSRLPECPHSTHGGLTEDAVSTHNNVGEPSAEPQSEGDGASAGPSPGLPAGQEPAGDVSAGHNGHAQLTEDAVSQHQQLIPVAGSREQGAGSREGEQEAATPRAELARTENPSPQETKGQRANRLTSSYHDKVKLSNFPAVAKIVSKAIDAGCTDEQITTALLTLADENRSVTTDTLRYAIYGMPGRSSPDHRQRADDDMFDRAMTRARSRQEVPS